MIAGKEYGSGSSRDWAAKGTLLLGVRRLSQKASNASIARTWCRWVFLPLQFLEGQGHESLGLTGEETYELSGVPLGIASPSHVQATAFRPDGKTIKFELRARIDTLQEAEYYRNGGILPYVLRQLIATTGAAA